MVIQKIIKNGTGSTKKLMWEFKFESSNEQKNGYLTVIRTVRIRYLSWNGSEHSFGILGSYRSCGYAWIVPQRKTHGEPSSYVKSPIRIRGAIFSMLRLKRYCGKVDTHNWLGPRSFERSSKTEPDEQKNWNENSNLNLPTNKKRLFNGYSCR